MTTNGLLIAALAGLVGCAPSEHDISATGNGATATTNETGGRFTTVVTDDTDGHVIVTLVWDQGVASWEFDNGDADSTSVSTTPTAAGMDYAGLALVSLHGDGGGGGSNVSPTSAGSGSGSSWGPGDGCNLLPLLPECYEDACDRHDDCWCRNGCGFASWGYLWGACRQCNIQVVADFIVCSGIFEN